MGISCTLSRRTPNVRWVRGAFTAVVSSVIPAFGQIAGTKGNFFGQYSYQVTEEGSLLFGIARDAQDCWKTGDCGSTKMQWPNEKEMSK